MDTLNSYLFNEGELRVPPAWTDQTLNIFKLPATDAAREASFIVSRDPSQGEDAFADYLDKQLAQCEKALPGYRLLLRRDYVCQGHLACWLDYQWRSDGRTLLLRQIFIERKPAVLIFTLTTTPEDAPHHESGWRQVMGSLKLVPNPAHDGEAQSPAADLS